jgi:TonB family protein
LRRTVSKPVNDISQIKKYLDGKLDAHAMHDLERRVQDDPFLADALEGYEQAGGDQQQNLAGLSARLQNRTDKKVRVMTTSVWLSIAALILIIISLGIRFVFSSKSEKQPQVADNIIKTEKPQQQPSISTPSNPAPQTADTVAKTTDGTLASVNPPAFASPQRAKKAKQSAEINPSAVKPDSSYAKVPVPQTTAPVAAGYAAVEDKNKSLEYKSTTQSANDAIVQGLADKKYTAKRAAQTVPETLLLMPKADMNIKPAHSGNNTLTGYVSGNNQPLVGAIVKLAGRDFGVVTDANGRFVMHDVPDNKSLVVKSLGFATKQVKVNGSDSVSVSLEPSAGALADVTIASPSANVNNSSTNAHPSAGWKAFNDYMDKNAVSPDGQTGKVKLSFTVDGRGALSGFKVTQSVSPQTDQKAIDLVTNGPAWAGNIDGQAHEVKVTVTFH